jgi:hypothetical protein
MFRGECVDMADGGNWTAASLARKLEAFCLDGHRVKQDDF